MAHDAQANPAAAIQRDSELATDLIQDGPLRPRTRTARAHPASEYAYPNVGLHASTRRRACVEPRPRSGPTARGESIADGRLVATVLPDALSTFSVHLSVSIFAPHSIRRQSLFAHRAATGTHGKSVFSIPRRPSFRR